MKNDNDNGTGTGVDSPLLNNFVYGVVDYKGRPVLRSKSGCWRSAYFIIGVEVAERIAYYGVSSNLITYLTGPLGQSTATAAENVNVWAGTASLLPLVGAFIADAFLGRYLTVILASLLYILALALLAFSTLIPSDCTNSIDGGSSCSPQLQVIIFFISLYLVAFAQGGHKPCVQAFGADQFDADDPEELKSKSSFFNWWYFGLCAGPTVGIIFLSYIQDNLSWGLGFGIPCVIMGFALIIFLFGTVTYRFGEKTQEKNAFARISHVFVTAARNWRVTSIEICAEEEASGIMHHQDSQQFSFLNKALVSRGGSNEDGTVCSTDEVEEAKAILRLIPIWVSCLGYGIVFAQTSTFFTKQGATMDRSIGSTFEIPPATLQSFIGLSVIILIPIYDTILVPLTRAITNKPSGITMLQRIGTGIFISTISMVVAAIVETKRLKVAREYGLLDDPNAIIPMKIWWLLPQYLLAGAGDVFTMVGMQEFFYDQMPSDLRSIGLALYLSIMGIGSFLSSFIISIVDKTTGGNGQGGWISDNMNQGHIDYFYYLLAGISAVAFVMFIYASRSYVYNRERGM
ncbi:putative proton-dependent oligopeptide transporter family, MFS transporter superfamily [Helianthus annuus]|nr:putative proton-dependent oligopeptide transporter family, MFS transporter superfamily [Helianthus annuus]